MASAASAGDGGWRFGIGTGLSSFGVDGDIGLPVQVTGNVPAGFVPPNGIVTDVDLDNGETSDLIDSAIGLSAFASNDDWTFAASFSTVSLEDSDGSFDATWDKSQAELTAAYNFATLWCNVFAVQFGVRYVEHEWDVDLGALAVPGGSVRVSSDVDENWTDAIVGITHTLPIAKGWVWRNVANYGFGGSEGTAFAQSSIIWQPLEHWAFNANARYLSTEYGDTDDLGDDDFYYYDADEPAFGLGASFVW